jgi:glycosyltransferase involved in cell wall biosynthesis
MNRGSAKQRFCLVGPAYPFRGGISHYNTSLIRELAKSHDVHAVNFKRLYPDFLFPGKTQLDESAKPFAVDSVRLIDSVNPFTWIRAGVHIAGWRPDRVIVQWWHPFFAPAFFAICLVLRMAAGRRARIVFICHNVLPHEKSLVDRLLACLAFALPDAFLVQSSEDRAKLLGIRRRAPVRVHPMPLFDFFGSGGVTRSEARARIGAAAGTPLLLFFGYVRPYKGLRYLIEAMPLVRARLPAELLVVGEFYEETAPYRDLVERLGLGGVVRFIDRYVANEEVESFFVASDLVVLPYVSATQSAVAQVAIAFDRPVVVTAVGGLPEVVSPGRTGFIVPPEDAASIAGAITRFFEEGWAVKMAPAFEEEKRRFSWEALARAIEELSEGAESR